MTGTARYDGIADWYDTEFQPTPLENAGLRLERIEDFGEREHPFGLGLRWRR